MKAIAHCLVTAVLSCASSGMAIAAQPPSSNVPSIAFIGQLSLRCLTSPKGFMAPGGYELKITNIKDDASATVGREGKGYALTAAESANGLQYSNRYSVDYIFRVHGGKWDDGLSSFVVTVANGTLDFSTDLNAFPYQTRGPNMCHFKARMPGGLATLQVLEERPLP